MPSFYSPNIFLKRIQLFKKIKCIYSLIFTFFNFKCKICWLSLKKIKIKSENFMQVKQRKFYTIQPVQSSFLYKDWKRHAFKLFKLSNNLNLIFNQSKNNNKKSPFPLLKKKTRRIEGFETPDVAVMSSMSLCSPMLPIVPMFSNSSSNQV